MYILSILFNTVRRSSLFRPGATTVHLTFPLFTSVGFRVFRPVRSVEDVSVGRVDKSRGVFRVSPLAKRTGRGKEIETEKRKRVRKKERGGGRSFPERPEQETSGAVLS